MKKPTKAMRCWWCNRNLVPGHFAIVTADNGQALKVHKSCKKSAIRAWKKVTARVSDHSRITSPSLFEAGGYNGAT